MGCERIGLKTRGSPWTLLSVEPSPINPPSPDFENRSLVTERSAEHLSNNSSSYRKAEETKPMNTQTVSAIAGKGFWVEPGDKTIMVGVVMNLSAEKVAADLGELRTRLKAEGFHTRFVSKGVYRQLRVWRPVLS